jgi:hypothetical protein
MLSLAQADLLHRIAVAPITVKGVLDRPTISRSLAGHGFIENVAERWTITDAGRAQFGAARHGLAERIDSSQEVREVQIPGMGTIGPVPATLIRTPTWTGVPTWIRLVRIDGEFRIARQIEPGPWVTLVNLPDTCTARVLDQALRNAGVLVQGRQTKPPR